MKPLYAKQGASLAPVRRGEFMANAAAVFSRFDMLTVCGQSKTASLQPACPGFTMPHLKEQPPSKSFESLLVSCVPNSPATVCFQTRHRANKESCCTGDQFIIVGVGDMSLKPLCQAIKVRHWHHNTHSTGNSVI